MCGIAGWIGVENGTTPSRVAAACAALSHRGPDDEGMTRIGFQGRAAESFAGADTDKSLGFAHWSSAAIRGDECAWFAHRRLSILDLSSAGHQPMSDPSGKVWIVFNGEIYNYKELREQLGGHFSSCSDTEVLLAGWKQWGEGMLGRLVGMFAFVLADLRVAHRPRIVMARDPFGIKPLYWARHDGGIVFASEIKALLAFGVSAAGNAERLLPYLNNGASDFGADSMFKGVHQIPSASWLEIEPGNKNTVMRAERYWNPVIGRARTMSAAEAAEKVRALFLDSIKLHLRSDVPVGAALSGGIDSSAIVGAMRYVEQSTDIRAFSYVADDALLSEERWMDMVAGQAGAQLHKLNAGPEMLANAMDALISCQDEPFGSTSIFVQYAVFGLAKANGIKVMLDGQGADELFAGYGGYAARRLETMIRRGDYGAALKFGRSATDAVGRNVMWRQAIYGLFSPKVRLLMKRVGGRGQSLEALDTSWFGSRAGMDEWQDRQHDKDRLRVELLHSVQVSSLPMLLRYEDRNSMAHSVESRVPFLTTDLAEFAFSIPENLILGANGLSKAVLREALRGLVPEPVLGRRDKIGFATPEERWLKQLAPWIDGLMRDEDFDRVPFLRRDVVRRQWSELCHGRVRFDARFWRWINLIAWVRRWDIAFE